MRALMASWASSISASVSAEVGSWPRRRYMSTVWVNSMPALAARFNSFSVSADQGIRTGCSTPFRPLLLLRLDGAGRGRRFQHPMDGADRTADLASDGPHGLAGVAQLADATVAGGGVEPARRPTLAVEAQHHAVADRSIFGGLIVGVSFEPSQHRHRTDAGSGGYGAEAHAWSVFSFHVFNCIKYDS